MRQVLIAGRYRLLELVGQGGMGRVWRARDEVLHREVAAKQVVPPAWLADGERDELRLRTLREARTAARIDHPAVVRVYDVVQVGDTPWIVMEYVPSRTLQDVLDTDGPLPPARAAELGLAVLDALRAAHTAGVLHRDVKPQNVLVAHDGRMLLTDFGLAVFDGGDGAMTRPGLVLGSPQYVAPERAAEGVSSVAADLWSLGATLHAAVEGRSPYARGTAMATLSALASGPPDPAPHAGPLEPVLAGLLRRDPTRRTDHAETRRRLAAAAGRTASGPPAAPVAPWPEGPPAGPGRHGPRSGSGRDSADRRPERRAVGRWALVATALLVAVAAGVGTAVAMVGDAGDDPGTRQWRAGSDGAPPDDHDRPPRGPAPGDPRVTAAGGPPPGPAPGDPGRPPPGRGVPPPPFPCVRPHVVGQPVTAASPTGGEAFRPPAGWIWHLDVTGFRVAVPAGWRYSRDRDVACFQDPATGRALSVAGSADATAGATARLRAARDRAAEAGTLPGYDEVRLGETVTAAEWDCRWDTPYGDRLRALHLVPTRPAAPTSWTLGWITRNADWSAARAQLATAQASFRPPR